jgi:lipopolysaccharide transport system permease protein
VAVSAERPSASAETTTIIQPSKGWVRLGLRELWRYRELLYFLTWKNILIQYKQAVLGVAWAVLNPIITMIVFTVIFSKFLHVGTGSKGGLPYPVFVYAGLLPWNLFSGSLSSAGASLVGNSNLITKVYFPRLVIPGSAVLGQIPNFLISFVVLIVLMVAYHVAPTWNVVFLPFFTLLALATAMGVSLWLSALYVLYRDVQYIIPFLVQIWMYVSFVMYPPDTIPHKWLWLFSLNPMTGVIEGFRWALFGHQYQAPNWEFWISVLMVMVVLMSGLYYFRRMERVFADLV